MRKTRYIPLFLYYFYMLIGLVHAESSGVAQVRIIVPPPEISVLSVSFAIIALGIAFSALAIAIKRREGEE